MLEFYLDVKKKIHKIFRQIGGTGIKNYTECSNLVSGRQTLLVISHMWNPHLNLLFCVFNSEYMWKSGH